MMVCVDLVNKMRKEGSEMEKIGIYIKRYVKGKTPKVLINEKTEGVLPYLSPDYLRGKCPPEQYAECAGNTVFVKDGEVIVLWDGSNAGEIFISRTGILASTMTLLEINEHELDKKYIGYTFQNLEYILRAKTAGSGIPHADKGIIKSLEFYKPNKSEQISIANILSKVDETIASVQNSIASAERLKKSLMQNLLTGKMKPDGTFRTTEEFYLDEKFGKVPIGWEVKKLKDIASIQRGKFGHRPRNDERFYNGDFPFVQTSDVVESVLYLKSASQSLNELGASVSKRFPQNTIIMTIAANIGYVALTRYEVYFPDSLIGINANENIVKPTYLLFQLMGFKNVLDALATESAQKNINYSNLRFLPILFPTNIEEQLQIAERIIETFKEIEDKKSKIDILERLKKSLMQNLLTGKIKVINN